MPADTFDFYCLGGAHIDSKASTLIKPTIGESIPARTSYCLGGVACNIALNLKSMHARVALSSRVGDDPQGRNLREELSKAGIDIADISLSKSSSTASYYALICERGELFIAVADMAVYDEVTPLILSGQLKSRTSVPHWVVDSNLSEAAIKTITEQATKAQSLWGVGVAAFKALRLKAGLPRWNGLFLNKEELFALSGETSIERGLKTFQNQCPLIVVSAGVKGLYFALDNTIEHRRSPAPVVVDVTGAGDALTAGILYGLFKGEDIESAIQKGFNAAHRTIATLHSSLP